MSPQEENAAIILSHSQVRPEFVQHGGQTIADLFDLVEWIAPEPITLITNEPERLRLRAGLLASLKTLEGPTVEEREPCPDCFDTGEMISRGYDGSVPDVEICPCRKVKR